MMDFNERVIPNVSSNFMFREGLSRYEFVRKCLKDGMEILDLGSGTGYGDYLISQHNVTVLGIDIDSEAVSYSNKKYSKKNLKFIKADILNMKFLKNEKFDLIISFEVIEHLKNPDKFLRNVNLLLKDNGKFIMSTPNVKVISPKGGVGSPYHQKEYEFSELKKMLSKNFKNVRIFGQSKSKKALKAWKDFLKSQKVRENLAISDQFNIRKLIPAWFKEFIWKYLGNFFGRGAQENLSTNDFPITNRRVKLCYYFVAVCQKYQL